MPFSGLHHAPACHVVRAVQATALAAANGAAWLADPSLGARVTALTVAGGVALAFGLEVLARVGRAVDARKIESAKSRDQYQLERERLFQGSLTGKLEVLQRTADEAARRVEDANAKCHIIVREARERDKRHEAEAARLTGQLEWTTKQLEVTAAELRAVREEQHETATRLAAVTTDLARAHEENRALLTRVAARAVTNSVKIERVAGLAEQTAAVAERAVVAAERNTEALQHSIFQQEAPPGAE